MKKLILTIFMAFCLCMFSFGENGGLFQRGDAVSYNTERPMLLQSTQNNVNEDTKYKAPLGSGILLLTALGGAYAVSKKHKH